LGTHNQQDLPRTVLLRMPTSLKPQAETSAQRACGARGLVGDLPRTRLEPEHCDNAFLFFEAALDMQRLPGTALLPFGEAGGEFAGRSQRRALDVSGLRAADVSQR